MAIEVNRRYLMALRRGGRRRRRHTLGGRVCRLRSARRRNCAWSLLLLLLHKLSPFFQPVLIIFRGIDDYAPLHAVVTESTQLAANDFVSTGFNRFEP